jgi:hypothetical protein
MYKVPLPDFPDCPKVRRIYSNPGFIEAEKVERLVSETFVLEEQLIQRESLPEKGLLSTGCEADYSLCTEHQEKTEQ